jgi:hypothetical protein
MSGWASTGSQCAKASKTLDVSAVHGPKNIPTTKAERMMLMSSQIFSVMILLRVLSLIIICIILL